jgi:hypothetical protein
MVILEDRLRTQISGVLTAKDALFSISEMTFCDMGSFGSQTYD